jgi:hypothetical protein
LGVGVTFWVPCLRTKEIRFRCECQGGDSMVFGCQGREFRPPTKVERFGVVVWMWADLVVGRSGVRVLADLILVDLEFGRSGCCRSVVWPIWIWPIWILGDLDLADLYFGRSGRSGSYPRKPTNAQSVTGKRPIIGHRQTRNLWSDAPGPLST